jgi:thioesterase domain-containing protein/acyl carrier protein
MNQAPVRPTLLAHESARCDSRVEQQLLTIWRRALERDDISPHDNFFDHGGESIGAVQVLAEMEKVFGVKFPTHVLLELPTVEQLAPAIRQEPSFRSWSPLELLQPGGPNPPFFCVHGVGGEVLSFLDLARHLPPGQPFYGLRAVGSDGEHEPLHGVEDMAAYYVEAIRSVQPRPPYYLGGFSFGGSVALEMAQQLHTQGARVALLAILDHTPPPSRYRRFGWSPALPVQWVVNAGRWVMEDVWQVGADKRLTTLRQKIEFTVKQLVAGLRHPGASGNTDVENIFGADRVPDGFRRLMATHYQALRDYTPKVYPGRVTLFRAQTRPLFRLHGRDLGWRKLAAAGLDIVDIPGNHETILKKPRVRVLARALAAQLRKAQAGGP